MTNYTPNRGIPYPKGADRVAVQADVRALALKTDAEIHHAVTTATEAINTAQRAAVPSRVTNLWTANWTSETMAINGVVTDHNRHRLSPFIRVEPGTQYSSHFRGLSRVLFFDTNQNVITGTDTSWQTRGEHVIWDTPDSARYARMVVDPGTEGFDDPILNRGSELYDPASPPPQTGWWNDKELPPGSSGGGLDPDALEPLVTGIVSPMLPQFQPSTPTLNFDPDWYVGYSRPRWLSQDGEVVWGSRGFILEQSTDEWATQQVIHEFDQGVEGVRSLDNGELLVTTARNESEDVRSKVWKSSGYDRHNPTAATWAEVLEAVSVQADFKSHWGLFVAGNMVTASEYGLRGVEGSRRVWLSEDYGDTWTQIFDQMTVQADGAPEWTTNAHLHGAAWDEYWDRVWVICGDTPSTATYYSDDKGQTWHFVPGSNTMQYTGIMPLSDTVVFGSDRTPNGLHVYHRGQKTDTPVIKPLLVVDDLLTTAKAFGLPFKRDRHPLTPTYFPGPDAGFNTPSVITGFVDGKKGHLLWQGQVPGSGVPLDGTIAEVLGPTAQGNILASMYGDTTVTGIRTMRAPAPTWARV